MPDAAQNPWHNNATMPDIQHKVYFSSWDPGHFQFTSIISTTVSLVELVVVKHGCHIILCSYWQHQGGCFSLFLALPKGPHHASKLFKASNITSIESILNSYHFECHLVFQALTATFIVPKFQHIIVPKFSRSPQHVYQIFSPCLTIFSILNWLYCGAMQLAPSTCWTHQGLLFSGVCIILHQYKDHLYTGWWIVIIHSCWTYAKFVACCPFESNLHWKRYKSRFAFVSKVLIQFWGHLWSWGPFFILSIE